MRTYFDFIDSVYAHTEFASDDALYGVKKSPRK